MIFLFSKSDTTRASLPERVVVEHATKTVKRFMETESIVMDVPERCMTVNENATEIAGNW